MRPSLQIWQGSLSLRSGVCRSSTRTHVRLLGPCFKTGQWAGAQSHVFITRSRTQREHYTMNPHDVASRAAPPFPWKKVTLLRLYLPTASSSTISSLLTLFSKFFSSFPHGTCSLSVSRKYLALEEAYLQLRAAIPSYPTLKARSIQALSRIHI